MSHISRKRHSGDRITITGLEVVANHGVFDFERRTGQRFVIDVTTWLTLALAAANDDLTQTLDYGELAKAVVAAAASDPVDLLETLAERIATVALSFSAVERVRVTVHKPEAPIDQAFSDISVRIVRW